MKKEIKTLRFYFSNFAFALIVLFLTPALLKADDVIVKQYEFPDSHTGKTIGLIKIVKNDEFKYPIRILISSVGIEVHAFQDFTGIRGYNLLTAKTLAGILDKNNCFAINIKNLSTQEINKANIILNEQDHFPIRRLNYGGDIEFLAKSPLQYPKSIAVSSNHLKDGEYEAEFIMNDQVRFILPFTVKGNSLEYDLKTIETKIGKFTSTNNSVFLSSPESEKGSKDIQNLVKVNIEVWAKLHLESKWVYFITAIDKNPNSIDNWINFLIARKEFKILEMFIMSNRNGFDDYKLGVKLFEADAPNWVSILHWIYANSDEHMNMSKDDVLTKKPELIKSWLDKFKINEPKMEYKLLNIKGGVDVKKYSDPIDTKLILKFLDCPEEVIVLKDEDNFLENKVYQHQVIRSINTLKGTKENTHWLPKLLKLTVHKNENIAQNALLAYTSLPSQIIPHDEFYKISEDTKKSNKIREAAFMAFTFGDHPMIYEKTHILIENSIDPRWKAAISRLGDIGDEFSLFYLRSFQKNFSKNLAKDQLDVFNFTLKKLTDQNQQKLTFEGLFAILQNGAYMDLTCGPLENEFKNWLGDFLLKKSTDKEINKMMQQLYKEIDQNKKGINTTYGNSKDRIKLYLKPYAE